MKTVPNFLIHWYSFIVLFVYFVINFCPSTYVLKQLVVPDMKKYSFFYPYKMFNILNLNLYITCIYSNYSESELSCPYTLTRIEMYKLCWNYYNYYLYV